MANPDVRFLNKRALASSACMVYLFACMHSLVKYEYSSRLSFGSTKYYCQCVPIERAKNTMIQMPRMKKFWRDTEKCLTFKPGISILFAIATESGFANVCGGEKAAPTGRNYM